MNYLTLIDLISNPECNKQNEEEKKDDKLNRLKQSILRNKFPKRNAWKVGDIVQCGASYSGISCIMIKYETIPF